MANANIDVALLTIHTIHTPRSASAQPRVAVLDQRQLDDVQRSPQQIDHGQ